MFGRPTPRARPIPKTYKKPSSFTPAITLEVAPQRFFAKFGPTEKEVEELTKDNEYWIPPSWEEAKIRAAFAGLCVTTVEYELMRLELGTFHDWDADPRIYSFEGRFG